MVLYFLQILFGLLLLASTLLLPSPPSSSVVGVFQLIALVLFLISSGVRIALQTDKNDFKALTSDIFTLLISVPILLIALSSAYPDYKSYSAAQAFNNKQQEAALAGAKAATEMRDKPQKPRPVSPNKFREDSELDEIFQQAYTAALDSESSAEEVAAQVIEQTQIPLVRDTWNCTQIGCAYVNDSFVWTSSYSNRYLAAIVVLLSVFVVVGFKFPWAEKSIL